MWPRLIPGLGVICAPRGFSPGTLVFPLSSKTNISKTIQFDLDYCQALYHEPLAREHNVNNINNTMKFFHISSTVKNWLYMYMYVSS